MEHSYLSVLEIPDMYVAQAVNALNPGASRTQMLRMSTGKFKA